MVDKNVVIILAGGRGQRWEGKTQKQLIKISGEPLIKRTQRQVKRFNWEPIVATSRDDIRNECERTIEPDVGCIAKGLVSCRECWGEKTVVLHGDVVFTDSAIQSILMCESHVRFFGRNKDVFGLFFDRFGGEELYLILPRLINYAVRGECEGNLHDLYTAYYQDIIFKKIDDWTQDFDTVEEYEKFRKAYG